MKRSDTGEGFESMMKILVAYLFFGLGLRCYSDGNELAWSVHERDIPVPGSGLVCQIGLVKDVFMKGEPVTVYFTVENRGDYSYNVVLPTDEGLGLRAEFAGEPKFTGLQDGGYSVPLPLSPGKRITTAHLLNRLVGFSEEGPYHGTVSTKLAYRKIDGGEIMAADVTEELIFRIVAQDDERLREMVVAYADRLRSGSSMDQVLAASALASMQNIHALPHLFDGLRSDDDAVARLCALGLRNFDQKHTGEQVVAALKDPRIKPRAKVILLDVARECVKEEAMHALCIELIHAYRDSSLTMKCLVMLGKVGVQRQRALAEKFVNDPHPGVRGIARSLIEGDDMSTIERIRLEIEQGQGSEAGVTR